MEAELKVDYKTVAKIGKYFEEIGAVTKFNKRGGTADYTITPLGLQWLNQELRKEKKKWVYLVAFVVMIAALLILKNFA